MALVGFRAPALPLPPPNYSFQQQAELLRALRLYFNLLDSFTPQQAQSYTAERFVGGEISGSSITGGILAGFNRGIEAPYVMLMSNQDQANAGATSENIVTFNQIVLSNGITVQDSTKIRFDYSGQYLINFRLQVVNKSNAVKEFEVWAKNSGTNYPLSNTRFDVPARKSLSIYGHTTANVAGIFTVDANEYLELAWWGEDTDVEIEHYAAGTSPTRPEVASVILTATFLSARPQKFSPTLVGGLSLSGSAPSLTINVPPDVNNLTIAGQVPTITIA